MGKLSRAKGAGWERAVAQKITSATGRAAARNLDECRGGDLGRDILVDLPLAIQCKVGQLPPVWSAVQEAQAAATRDGIHAVAILRRNGKGSRKPVDLAVMPLDDWLKIVAILTDLEVW